MKNTMQSGDFTHLAQEYAKYRPGYSTVLANALFNYVDVQKEDFRVADVGAGTGIWSRYLLEQNSPCICVEPNDAMRGEGIEYTRSFPNATWQTGSAEETGLDSSSVDWLTMASSFHWVETEVGLREFKRVLKTGGHFTALWNPRNIEGNELHEAIERIIYDIAPNIKRKSSGGKKHVDDMYQTLISTHDFTDVLFMETPYTMKRTKEEYIGAWRSVNDIQVQAGPGKFEKIITGISDYIDHLDFISVPYLVRAWTATVIK